MDNSSKLTASSCAVEKTPDGLRLSLSFFNFGEFDGARTHIQRIPGLKIDDGDPLKGGTVGGSKLVIHVNPDFVQAAGEALEAFKFRRPAEYVNGSRQPCANVGEAIALAHNHI